MTPSEFKAWFDGFSEGIESLPTETQWKRIKARVAEIDGVAISYPVFVQRYWPAPNYYSTPYVYCGGSTGGGGSLGVTATVTGTLLTNAVFSNGWNSHTAMAQLGRDEALAA